MNKIKEFRTQLGLTQKDLAALMNTTQQTIGRWENGTSEPSLSNLRDLAIKLGTTTSALLGEPFAPKQSSYYHLMFKEEQEGLDGFWGNLGVLPIHRDKSIWYPITLGGVCDTSSKIGEGEPFMFESLNNKLVFINPSHIKRFVTLDDASDAFPNDWEVSWLEFGHESPEIFDALEIYMQETYWGDEPDPDNSLSDTLRAGIEKLVEEHKLDEEAILKLTSGIRIFYADGSMEAYNLREFSSIAALFTEIEFMFAPSVIHIEDDEYSFILPLDNIAIIEFPLAKVMEALKKDLEDFDELDDDDETEDTEELEDKE